MAEKLEELEEYLALKDEPCGVQTYSQHPFYLSPSLLSTWS